MSTIQRNGSRPSAQGSEEYFTGNVRVDPLFASPDPARATGGLVTFEPGAHYLVSSRSPGATQDGLARKRKSL